MGLAIALSALLTAFEWSTGGPSIMDLFESDTTVEMELMPALERNDMISAPKHEQKKVESEQIRKADVEDISKPIDLQELLKFVPTENDVDDAAEEIIDNDVPPLEQATEAEEGALRVLEELPEYPGGYSELVQWLTQTLHYPADAQKHRIEGEVMVKFFVEPDGSISEIGLAKPAAAILNSEALRVVRMMPKWNPGKQKGKPVRSMVQIPVIFAL